MAEIDRQAFGEPSILLTGPSSLNAGALPAPSEEAFTSNGLLGNQDFSPGGFLGGGGGSSHAGPSHSLSEEDHDDDVTMGDVPESRNSPSEDAFSLGSLLGGSTGATRSKDAGYSVASNGSTEVFMPTGLLSGFLDATTAGGSGSTEGFPSASQSQSQDEDFPSVLELLRPYASAAKTLNASSSAGPSTSSIRTSTFDGRLVFLRRKPPRSRYATATTTSTSVLTGTTVGSSNAQRKYDKLLDVPIHRLLDQLASAKAANLDKAPSAAPVATAEKADATLWFDRYRPKRFTELLGDDRVHREVTAWVKEWDWCVFGARKGRGRKRPLGDDEENKDEWRRPHEKLLLLSGPPGMGKTTLAHIVAQHAGYTVFEVNASDARTAMNFDQKVRPALETGYMIGSSKPILVVIDEIDGATGGTDHTAGFIQKLISLTFDKHKKKGRKANPQATRPLLRPIVCICNDLYASSLAKLRQHARIVRCGRPNDMHLVRRLREICDCEGVRVEARALTTLVGVAQGDMRACLNALQMITKKGVEISDATVRKETSDIKQADTSQIAVLNDLFAPMARKRAKDLGVSEEEETRYISRLSREVEASGALDRIAVGCFEHYINLHRHDANFTRYIRGHGWLTMYDMMSGAMYADREFELLQYLAYPLVAFYPLFQERGGPRVERSQADYENHLQTKMNEEIYRSLAHCLRGASLRHGGGSRHLASAQILQLEVAPLLNRMISPPLQPVNSQVIRPGDRALLSRLVDIMVTLELRFIQERAEDGQLVYRLDPPIDVFVTYDGKRASDIAVSRYALRHLVAGEIESKLASRHGAAEGNNPGPSEVFHAAARKHSGDADDEPEHADRELQDPDVKSAAPAKRARLKGPERNEKVAADFFGRPIVAPRARQKEVAPAEKIATDFFGRPIVAPAAGQEPSSGKIATPYRVTYRFREGNSAAVRKSVKVAAFL